jgi:hypothetical protein
MVSGFGSFVGFSVPPKAERLMLPGQDFHIMAAPKIRKYSTAVS